VSIGDKLSSLFAPSPSNVQPMSTPTAGNNPGAQVFGQGSGSSGSSSGTNLISGTQIPSTGDPAEDALIQSVLTQNKGSPWMSAIAGLGPVAAAFIDKHPELAGMAPASKGAGPAMGPLPLAANAPPTSPIALSSLIAELV
jgi:hypothetical protein